MKALTGSQLETSQQHHRKDGKSLINGMMRSKVAVTREVINRGLAPSFIISLLFKESIVMTYE